MQPVKTFSQNMQDVASSPLKMFDLASWGVSLVGDGIGLGVSIANLTSLDSSAPDYARKSAKAVKEFTCSVVGGVGSAAYIAEWSHRMNIINIAPYDAPLGILGGATRLFVSGWRLVDDVNKVDHYAEKAEKATTQKAYHRARHKQGIALLQLIANVLTVAWAALSIVGIILASPVLLGIVDVLFASCTILYIGKFCYEAALPSGKPKPN